MLFSSLFLSSSSSALFMFFVGAHDLTADVLQSLVNENRLTVRGHQAAMNEVGRIEAVTLTRGGLGCALSHIQLWEHVVHTNETILVLEDDVRLSPSFQDMYSLLSLPKKFDLIYLSYPDFGRRTNWIKKNKRKNNKKKKKSTELKEF